MSDVEEISVPIGNIFKKLRDVLLVPRQKKQGPHIDPLNLTPPMVADWVEDRREAWASPEMEIFRNCLRSGDLDVRASILNDLSRFYGYTPTECHDRCIEWEAWSVKEWSARERQSRAGLQDFYDTVQSWSFDLLWYAYLQAEGFGYPASVLAVRYALNNCPGGRHLDFGSGIGVTSQLFSRCGFSTTSADVSKPLLAFASWRIDQHGDKVERINLTEAKLETAAYDIVTAVDTLVHVPDFDESVRELHRVIRSGGWLLTNFDVRDSDSVESANHIHNNPVKLEHGMVEGGFRRVGTIAGVTQVYQRVDPTALEFRLRLLSLRLQLPFKMAWALLARTRLPTPRRIKSLIARLRTN
jgi:SAM-dependent methyltransferase